jgi:hypothetical protein
MKFNLVHFLTKRKFTIKNWLKENNINSYSEYEVFLNNSEFYDNEEIRREINDFFTIKINKNIEFELENSTKVNIDINVDIDKNLLEDESSVEEIRIQKKKKKNNKTEE